MWGFLKELIAKQRFPVFLLLVGALLFLSANYAVIYANGALRIGPRPPSTFAETLGALSIMGAVALYCLGEGIVPAPLGVSVRKTRFGFETNFRDMKLCVDFGLLEELYGSGDRESVVALPTNEFFDERCFNDAHTAAGAFVQRRFPARGALALRDLVEDELRPCRSEVVETGPGQSMTSYGVGSCAYLDEPLGQPDKILFVSVATDRPPHGLRTELSAISRAVEAIRRTLAVQRLSRVYVPLLGSGKGGVPPGVAFLTLVSALLDAKCREGGHHLKEAHVVIFKPAGGKPLVTRRRARRGMRHVVTLYEGASK